MPIQIDGKTYFRTAEVCNAVGISKNTLLRWIKQELCSDAECRDRRGWRLFTAADLELLKSEVNRTMKAAD